ncbi:MAG: DUF1684 domain-containing protein [Tunicatimonas sp.]
MKKLIVLLLSLTTSPWVAAQSGAVANYFRDTEAFQQALNEEYADSTTSPLLPHDRENFSGLPFYPIDAQLRVTARFMRTPGSPPFAMPTSRPRRTIYEQYGKAQFTLRDTTYELLIYQSHELRVTEKYRNHLLLPFTDLTSGTETYGGGRYLELTIPKSDTIVIDFNKAYHPYCAYNPKYACPIPPRENNLPVAIRAGVRLGEH